MKNNRFGIKHYVLLIGTLLVVILAGMLTFEIYRIQGQYQQLAVNVARSYTKTIVNLRSWNAEQGGFYVSTDNVDPNPYLDDPLRDVETRQGEQLTKINPAYMTRLFGKVSERDTDVSFHMTSLNPINPQNTPDSWERGSLLSFEKGIASRWTIVSSNDKKFLRYIEPLPVTKNCLQCHAEQGYKVGDIRGGLSVNIPYRSFEAAEQEEIRNTTMLFIVFIVITIIIAMLFGYKSIASEQMLKQYSKKLKHLSHTDELTELYNRRYLMERLDNKINYAITFKEPLSLMILDLDDFKEINDTYGHFVGDKVLQTAARVMKDNVRSIDIVGRYGGDEFIILLPGLELSEAENIANRVKNAMRNTSIQHKTISITQNISVGVAQLSVDAPYDEDLMNLLIQQADKQLYVEKEAKKRIVD